MMRSAIFSLVLLIASALPASALIVMRNVTVSHPTLGCWRYVDIIEWLYVEFARKGHEVLQWQWDALQDGRCFELKEGDTVRVEMLIRNPYATITRLRKPDVPQHFWGAGIID